jgi:hypothetical protein
MKKANLVQNMPNHSPKIQSLEGSVYSSDLSFDTRVNPIEPLLNLKIRTNDSEDSLKTVRIFGYHRIDCGEDIRVFYRPREFEVKEWENPKNIAGYEILKGGNVVFRAHTFGEHFEEEKQ